MFKSILNSIKKRFFNSKLDPSLFMPCHLCLFNFYTKKFTYKINKDYIIILNFCFITREYASKISRRESLIKNIYKIFSRIHK